MIYYLEDEYIEEVLDTIKWMYLGVDLSSIFLGEITKTIQENNANSTLVF